MRRWKTYGGALLAMAALTSALAAGRMMSVQVKDGVLRMTPSFLGRVVGAVVYGDRLEVQEEVNGWARAAAANGTMGWIHSSALTPKTVVLAAGSKDVAAAASGEELALAGKGFNAEVEAAFKAAHPNVSFIWVDWMEKITVSPSQMALFLKDGNVQSAQGGF
jgi:SH3-like domain-containing protein